MGMPVLTGLCKKEEVIGDVIESIAMEEKALAHILNAESEKLQAIINKPGVTPAQLMCVNRSVETTIQSISRLEMLLQAKLDLFHDRICG